MPYWHIGLVCIGGTLALIVAGVLFPIAHSPTSQPAAVSTAIQNQKEYKGQVVSIDPNASLGELYAKAEYYFSEADYNLPYARQYFEAVLEREPAENSQAWYQLGRIDFLEGKYDPALYKFNKQLEYFGDQVPNVYYMIGLTYGYKARESKNPEDWQKAEENFKKSIEYFPTSPWSKVDLAWVYFAQGKYEEMKPLIEAGLVDHPENTWLLNMYGLALLNTGEKNLAHEYFVKAQAEATKVTTEEWGRNYPGNNPASWKLGLEEMQKAIAHNVAVSAE